MTRHAENFGFTAPPPPPPFKTSRSRHAIFSSFTPHPLPPLVMRDGIYERPLIFVAFPCAAHSLLCHFAPNLLCVVSVSGLSAMTDDGSLIVVFSFSRSRA